MGALTAHDDVGTYRALATGLDDGIGRFHEDRKITFEQFGVFAREQAETIELRGNLFGVVEDERDVAVRLRDSGREPQGDSYAAFHVAGAKSIQKLAFAPGRQVSIHGHGVEVARDDDPLVTAQIGARDDRIAVTSGSSSRATSTPCP